MTASRFTQGSFSAPDPLWVNRDDAYHSRAGQDHLNNRTQAEIGHHLEKAFGD
jgi:hypothetical protein